MNIKSKNLLKLFLVLLFVFVFAFDLLAEPIVVIVNKNNPVDNLSINKLSEIFKCQEKKWENNKKIVPINSSFGSGIRNLFIEKVHSKTSEDMQKYWLEQKFKGNRAPMMQKSSIAVLKMTSNIPGAIGYVFSNELTPDVKAIKINGLKHTDDNYPLK